MADSSQDDVVWVDVLPSMDKLVPSLRRSLPSAGRQAGQLFGQSLTDAASEKVGQASSKMTAALKKVQDAAGQVAVAEAKLQALRDKEITDTGRLAAAEEAIARARRNEITANTALSTATKGVAAAQEQLATATRLSASAEDEATKQAGQLARAQGAAAASTDRVSVAHRALYGVIGGVGAVARRAWLPVTATLVAAGAIGIKTAANMETADIGFTTMLGSGQKAAAFLRKLQQFAAATPFEFPELQTAASSLISIGIDANQVIPIMTTLGNVTSGMGTGSEGIKRATVALQQMNAAQRIQAQDLNQLRDAGIPVYDLLSAALGKTKGEVAALAQNGKLGKDALDKMMAALETGKGLERFNGLMQKQSQSLTGLWSTVKDTVQMDLAQMWQPMIPSLKAALNGATPLIGSWLQSASRAMAKGIKIAPTVFSAAKDFVTGRDFTPQLGQLGVPVSVMHGLEDVRDLLKQVMAVAHDVGPVLGVALGGSLKLAWQGFQILLPAVTNVLGFLDQHRALLWSVVGAWAAMTLATKAHEAALAVDAAGGMVAWIRQIKIVTVLSKVWAAVQWLLNIALDANPIGLIVIGLTALGAALYLAWTHSKTFRDVVIGAWTAIQSYVSFAWAHVIGPVVHWVIGAWQAVGTTAVWLWQDVLVPAFDAIGSAWQTTVSAIVSFWNSYLRPVFTVIGNVATVMAHILLFVVLAPFVLAWKAVTAVVSAYWEHVLQPVFRAVAAVAQWMWSSVLLPVFGALEAGWRATGTAFQWVWLNVLQPTVRAVAAGGQWLWGSVLKPVFGFIQTAWQVLVMAIQWYWHNVLMRVFNLVGSAASFMWGSVLKPVFSAIGTAWHTLGDGLVWVYHHLIQPIWGWFGSALDTIKRSFSTAVDWIGKVWHGLESVLLAPVQFVIDVVWNNGLRGLWNTINNIWGGKDLGPFKITGGGGGGGVTNRASTANARGMATGGTVLPGWSPGRDIHRFWSPTGGLLDLSGGEAVMVPEWTRAVGGPAAVAAMNEAARRQSFAGGGTVSLGERSLSFLGSGLGQILTSTLIPGAGTLISVLSNYVAKERGLTADHGSTPVWQMLGDLIRTGANSTWGVIKRSVAGAASSLGGNFGAGTPASQAPSSQAANVAIVRTWAAPYNWQSGPEWDAIVSVVNRESGFRNTAQNPTSSAFGMFQFLDSTWGLMGGRKTADSTVQAQLGMKYFSQVYGDPLAALRHEQQFGWYHDGGKVTGGPAGATVPAFLKVDERVLTAPQDDYFRRRVELDEARDRRDSLPTSLTGFANYGTIHTDPETLARKSSQGTRRVLATVLAR